MASFGITCVSGSAYPTAVCLHSGSAYPNAVCLHTDDFKRFPTAHTRVRILLDLLLRHHIECQCTTVGLYFQVISVHKCTISSI
jgi:hypothetical protein